MTSRTRLLVLFISAPVIAFAVIGGLLNNVMVARSDRKNSSTTNVTSTTARISVNCTSRTEARMVTVRSLTMCRFTPAGIKRWTLGISARIC